MTSTSRLPFSDHRRDDFMDIDTLDSDTEFAFQLQLQEALTASLATQPSSSAAGNDVAPVLVPMAQAIRDVVQSQTELRRSQVDLARAIHDSKFAREIVEISDDEWEQSGADFARPFEAGASSSAEESEFRLYFKGLVSEEQVGDQKLVLAGIGVAICDDKDNLVFEIRRPLIGNGLSRNSAQLKALIEGLTAALSLGLKRITVFCDNHPIVQFVNGNWSTKQKKILNLVNQVKSLQSKFTECNVTLVGRLEIKFAFKFARDAIESQSQIKPEESTSGKVVKQTCEICMEDSYLSRMFSVDGCLHRYCFSCMKQHVEVQLQNGIRPKCPHADCKSDLSVDSCAKFLSLKHVDTMHQRIKEASIPASERVYCPYPRCSFLMSKSEVLQHSKDTLTRAVETSGRRRCMKCQCFFCINCKVPWHKNITCANYEKSNPNPPEEDTKLKSLASSKRWQRCVKCSHMIELLEGCYHMTCRCNYEFCYNCGAEWKNKNPTCKCPLWHEDNILHEEEADSDSDLEYISDEEEEDEYQIDDEEEDKVGGHEYENDDEDQYESGSGAGEVLVPEGQIQEQCLDKDFENYISSGGSDLFGKEEEDEDFDGEYQTEHEDNEDESHDYEDDNDNADFDGDEYLSEHEEDNEDEGHDYEDDNDNADFDGDECLSEHAEDDEDQYESGSGVGEVLVPEGQIQEQCLDKEFGNCISSGGSDLFGKEEEDEDFDGEYQTEHEEDNEDEGHDYEDKCVVVEDQVQEGQIQEEDLEMDMVDHMSSDEDIYFDEDYEEDEVEDYCDFDGCDSDSDL